MERVEYTISGNCHPGASLGQLHNDGNGKHRDRENRIDDGSSKPGAFLRFSNLDHGWNIVKINAPAQNKAGAFLSLVRLRTRLEHRKNQCSSNWLGCPSDPESNTLSASPLSLDLSSHGLPLQSHLKSPSCIPLVSVLKIT